MKWQRKKIYIWINQNSPGWVLPYAICEDGNVLAQHTCSHEHFVKFDMGITQDSDRKHDLYDEHCGKDNWELEYIEEKDVLKHEGLTEAFRLNELLTEEAKEV